MTMRKQKGFTLIEAMIAFVAVAIVFIMAIGIFAGLKDGNMTVGINGITDSRCVNGFVIMQNANGTATQLLNEFGKGVPCQQNNEVVQ